MIRFAGMTNLGVWYARIDADRLAAMASRKLTDGGRRNLDRAMDKARTRDSLQAFAKLTETVDGRVRIAADLPLLVPLTDLLPEVERDALEERLRSLIRGYARSLQSDRRALLGTFRFVDAARKVVGVGSVGTRCWIILLTGRDGRDPLFLQARRPPHRCSLRTSVPASTAARASGWLRGSE